MVLLFDVASRKAYENLAIAYAKKGMYREAKYYARRAGILD